MKEAQWLEEVAALLGGRYCIETKDIGWSEADQKRYLSYKLAPNEFVEWLGMKFDLTDRRSLGSNPTE